MDRTRERLKDGLAWAATLPVLLLPVSNPDLFWHLSTAARIVSHHGLPRDDYLSFTRLGAPWVDFEWLVQLILLGFHGTLGWAGLWALKVLLMVLAAAAVWALAGLHSGGALRRWTLLFWAALSLPRSELKPELFSAILFTAELWALEAERLGRLRLPPLGRLAAVSAAFFCFWANLHPGFPMGLLLIAAYALGRGRLAPALAALGGGLAGTLLNPYGWRLYGVLADHARWFGMMSSQIMEWQPPTPASPFSWPLLLLLAALPVLWSFRWRVASRPWSLICSRDGGQRNGPDRPPLPHMVLAGILGLQWLLVARRQAAYFVPVGLLCLLESCARVGEGRLLPGPRLRAGLAAAACAVYAAYAGWLAVPRLLPPRAFDGGYLPAAACDFVESNLDVFRHRRVFNEWGWGGYLSYRFEPEVRVFMDGRYLFHPLLAEAAAAQADPRKWQDFLDRWGVEWTLLVNSAQPVEVVQRLRGGGVRRTQAPHLSVYMPAYKWALVYQDGIALVYVRRGALPDAWLAGHEQRYEWRR